MAEQKVEKLNLRNVAGKDLNKAKVREVVMNDYNSRGRGRSNAKKKTSREKYLARKRIVLDLEKRNKQYLVFLKQITEKNIATVLANNTTVRIIGLPFYNEKLTSREFKDALSDLDR